jgi:hypothetical protein
LPLVSLALAANLPPVSLTPVVPLSKFAAMPLMIQVVHLDLQIYQRIFEKIRNDPSAIFRGLGEDDS